MRTLLASLLAASLALASSTSRADDDTPPADAPKPTTTWYGYQTLATDGVALALFIPAAASGSSATQQGFAVGSVAMYGLGAPIVHLSHGHIAKGLLDLGLRVGMPVVLGLVGGAIGAASTSSHPDTCGGPNQAACGLGEALAPAMAAMEGAAIGGMFGIGGAVAIDAAVIAREPAKHDDDTDDAEPVSRPERSTAMIQPAFGVAPEREGGARATAGVVGTF